MDISLCKPCLSHNFDTNPFGPHGMWDTCSDQDARLAKRTPDEIEAERRALNYGDWF